MLICQETFLVFAAIDRKKVNISEEKNNFFAKKTKNDGEGGEKIEKTWKTSETFFKKGVAISEGLWYNSEVSKISTRGTAG